MAKDDRFVNLHNHTCIGSILDGYGLPSRMVKRAHDLGQPAIAITDHGSIAALVDTKMECERYGIKFIPGIELYLAPWGKDLSWRRDDGLRTGTARHLTVWAHNQEGYQNILKLVQISNHEAHYFHVPRVSYEILEQHNAGLIVTSGCMASEIGAALNPETGVTNKDFRRVNEVFGYFDSVFGRDRFYIEMQGHDIEALRSINRDLVAINKHYGFPYIATNDSHYALPEDAAGQVDVMCVARNCSHHNPVPFVQQYADHPGYYIPDRAEMLHKNYGVNVPVSALDNTLKVAEMVEDIKLGYEPEVMKYRFPIMPEYEDGYDKHLADIAMLGFCRRYPDLDDRGIEAQRRLQHELSIVKQLGFSSYFLCIYDISQYCLKEYIPMTLRGSAGGSIIFYCLYVTDFCPLEYKLIFERFLNPDRIDAPDADLDIDPARRGQVIKYIISKYGNEHAAQIANFIFIKGKMAIRDATRIMEYPYHVGDDLVARIFDDKATISGTMSRESVYYNSDFISSEEEREVVDIAIGLEGQVKTMGIHAGAVMLSDTPLVDTYPLIKPSSKSKSSAVSKLLVGMPYKTAEKLGGIKIDVLGVEALGILYEAMRLINQRHGTSYTFDSVPVDDPASFDLINSGRLAEIFQLAKYAGRNSTKIICPQSVLDVMVVNSICRPGPNAYEQLYADRLHGHKPIEYKHPDLEPVLRDTQGIMLFQEGVMRASQVIAGFSNSQADTLRKSISKKSGFEKIKKLFIAGAKERGHSDEFIEEMWDDMAQFNGYGFNMPHSCAYARIAVKQAYLKYYYPIEFYAAAMTGRATNQDGLVELMKEMSQSGIKLLPVQVGSSQALTFSIDDETNGIRYPYRAVKHVGKAGLYLQNIGEIKSHEDITEQQLKMFKKAGSRALNSLALVGALDHIFDGDRNMAVEGAKWLAKGRHFIHQLSIEEDAPQYSHIEFLRIEKELTGTYMSGHPLDGMPENKTSFADQHLYERMHGEIVFLTGVVSRVREHRQRDGRLMAFFELEDRDYNMMKFVMFADQYNIWSNHIALGNPLRIIAEIDVKYGKTEEEEEKAKKYGRVSAKVKTVIGVNYAKQN